MRTSLRRKMSGVTISPSTRASLYAQAQFLPHEFKVQSGLLLPFFAYFQDPFLAEGAPQAILSDRILVPWEPNLTDGPTSSRFAIVDYNADTGRLKPPAVWDPHSQAFVDSDGRALDSDSSATPQFHQVSVWVLLQSALAFFEDGSALGRSVAWAFEGNRLIVVPHAGYGEQAFYDRHSQSLQFYSFGSDERPTHTCLASDIVYREFGRAVIDGIRPLYSESVNPQTAAFQEFIADLTAHVMTMQSGGLRHRMSTPSVGSDEPLARSLDSAFEEMVSRPYLRTARNSSTMSDLTGEMSAFHLSTVLTATVLDIWIAIAERFRRDARRGFLPTARQSLFYAMDRTQRLVIQPIDLLPPVEVTFRDYAIAVCRSQQLSDPSDPDGHYDLLLKVFRNRGVLTSEDEASLREPGYLVESLQLSVHHNLDDLSRSRASAYRFLDDNREDLLIPANRDFFVADLYDARKRGRRGLSLPRQIVVQYGWREDVPLDGARFGPLSGRSTTMLCGGTLIFNEDSKILSWMIKPGSHPYGGKRSRMGRTADMWAKAVEEGASRRTQLLEHVAAQMAAGRVGRVIGSDTGLMGSHIPPLIAEGDQAQVRFRISPPVNGADADTAEKNAEGDRRWVVSW